MSGVCKCIGCSVCLLVAVVIVFVILSFSSLPVNTNGLDYSPITKKISPMVYESGFHYLGFMHKFIEYPSTMLTFDFSKTSTANRQPLEARSKDGLMVSFSTQFQYQLQTANLTKLYTRYGDDYKNPCIRFAVDTMTDKASQFPASMFFRNLTVVVMDMQETVNAVFQKECYANVQTLQITEADLPSRYEDALTATNVALQEKITVAQEQNNTVIDMETLIKQAMIAAPIVVNQANATVNALLNTNQAKMEAYYAVTKSEAQGYKLMKTQLGFSQDADLLKYIKVKAINSFNPKNLVIGI